jgi:hypothetical protein
MVTFEPEAPTPQEDDTPVEAPPTLLLAVADFIDPTGGDDE